MIEVKYNYHSHTYRCGHASRCSDEDYVLEAIEHGYKKYGFSDHVSVHPIFYWDDTMRMHHYYVNSYLKSINRLKEDSKDFIDIFVGFEADYDEVIESYLCDLRDKCDYMILGQHYVLGKDIRHSVDYPIEYAKKVCAAIESGIFDVVAHPDIFMQYRYNISADDFDEYIDNCILASKFICIKAKEYDIPLEINLGGFITRDISLEPRYPTKLFWDIVKENGNKVVIGVDAHQKRDIQNSYLKLGLLRNVIDFDSLNILDDFDPVIYRENNSKLKDAYSNTKSNLTSVESRLISSFEDRDELFSNLKKFPKHDSIRNKFFDYLTFLKREKLIRQVKKSPKEDIVSYIDKHYSKNKVKQKIKER